MINWVGYYIPWDGFGRFNSRLVRALQRQGVEVTPLTMDNIHAPAWLHEQWGVDWNNLTISCIPSRQVQAVPGATLVARHWLYSMCEGSVLAAATVKRINASGVERVLVPCQHNADAFARSGVSVPIHVVHGGTDPDEFPLRTPHRSDTKPYTFLALADRGPRKGWHEVFDAFYQAFGGKTTGVQDVRLIVKALPGSNQSVEILSKGVDMDKRVIWQNKEAPNDDMALTYAQADCFVIPSYSEGWGLPHRECAMMGIPVITQSYSGMDDGHTHEWALVVDGGHIESIGDGPVYDEDGYENEKVTLGEWMIPNVDNLAAIMQDCVSRPAYAAQKGLQAAAWLRANQTWDHVAWRLMSLIEEVDSGLYVDQNPYRGVPANGSSLYTSRLPVG